MVSITITIRNQKLFTIKSITKLFFVYFCVFCVSIRQISPHQQSLNQQHITNKDEPLNQLELHFLLPSLQRNYSFVFYVMLYLYHLIIACCWFVAGSAESLVYFCPFWSTKRYYSYTHNTNLSIEVSNTIRMQERTVNKQNRQYK